MRLECLLPDKFLFRYPLSIGATVFAIIFAIVKIICIIVAGLQILEFSRCDSPPRLLLRSAYGYSGAFIIICIIMLLTHLWYLWRHRQLKSSLVLVWTMTTSVWLGQTFCLTLVLLCVWMDDVSLINWLLSFIFGLIAFVIAGYGVLVGFGLYKEMKNSIQQTM